MVKRGEGEQRVPFKDFTFTEYSFIPFIVLEFIGMIWLFVLAAVFVADAGFSEDREVELIGILDVIRNCILAGAIVLLICFLLSQVAIMVPSWTAAAILYGVNIAVSIAAQITYFYKDCLVSLIGSKRMLVVAIIPSISIAAVSVFCTGIESTCYDCPPSYTDDECSDQAFYSGETCWYRSASFSNVCDSLAGTLTQAVVIMYISVFVLFMQSIFSCVAVATTSSAKKSGGTNTTTTVVVTQNPTPATVVQPVYYPQATPQQPGYAPQPNATPDYTQPPPPGY